MINSKHLVVVAMLEAVVMASAVLRMALPDFGFDLNSPPQLAWLVVTLMMAAAGVAHFVVRSALLGKRSAAGENVEDDRKQALTVSIAIVVSAGLLSLAGPSLFVKLLS